MLITRDMAVVIAPATWGVRSRPGADQSGCPAGTLDFSGNALVALNTAHMQDGARLAVACPACQASNPPDNRFCHRCGGALESRPAAVDPSPSPRSYTPRHLAEKILTTGAALKGERKQVTVLFVDVSGFTSLSERLDPEEVHRLMSRAFDLMLAEVHRYEGTVNQFLGDGIMAIFGAPIAHEDHAIRAVHAALGIARTLDAYQAELRPRGIRFQARQGLNTGLVVVGSIGSDLRMDYTAVGDATNVAARMQQVGEPGRVTISEATHRLVHGYFETRALGEKQLKGKVEPMPAWEVVTARETRTRLDVEVEHGLTPLVGRERELGFVRIKLPDEGQTLPAAGTGGPSLARLGVGCASEAGPQRRERAGVLDSDQIQLPGRPQLGSKEFEQAWVTHGRGSRCKMR